MTKPHAKIGELLVKEGLLSEANLAKALKEQKEHPHELLGAILLKHGFISEKDLVVTLSKSLGIPYATKEKGLLTPDPSQNLSSVIPEEFARKHCVLALALHYHSLTVALTDPLDIVLLDNLHKITGFDINRVIAPRKDIEEAIDGLYVEGGMLKSAIEESYAPSEEVKTEASDSQDNLSLDDLVARAEKFPVVKLADLLLRQAIKSRSSDIHLEPFYDRVTIRFRIDGVLQEIPPPDKSMFLPLVSRLKILAKMDISEKRLPQDGSFRVTIENRSIDFRVSTIPTIYGEKMALRILDRSTALADLKSLGLTKDESALFQKVIRRPQGMIYVTGPTGSGKTTTIYAMLNDIKGADKNILTIEDPVEYQMAGINQVQAKPAIGLTFASALRAFLRQDPDVMLIGETRDLETAQICIRAALTGHLVFSTLHTNDAPSTIIRLMDIGVEPYMVISSLAMVVAQRLIRRLCPKCKEAYEPKAASLPKNFKMESSVLYKPRGCEDCSKTGYLGRLAIFEIMLISEPISQLILRKCSVAELREEAKKAGMCTLEESGYKKMFAGETSIQEVMRVANSVEIL